MAKRLWDDWLSGLVHSGSPSSSLPCVDFGIGCSTALPIASRKSNFDPPLESLLLLANRSTANLPIVPSRDYSGNFRPLLPISIAWDSRHTYIWEALSVGLI